MKADDKKLIVIGSIILVILMVVAAIWYLIWFLSTKTISKNQINLVSSLDEKVFSPQYNLEQQSIYYFDQGLISKFSFKENKTSILYPNTISYLQKAKFSPDGQKAIILVKEGDHYVYKSINFASQEISPLSNDIIDIAWLSNEQIVYTYLDPVTEQGNFNKANFDGQNWQKLADLNFPYGIIVLSPDKTKAVIYPEPEGYGENFLTMYDFTNNQLTDLGTKGMVGAIFSPNSQKFITNVYQNEADFSTTIFDLQSQKTKKLDFNTSLDKITWQSDDKIVAAESVANKSDQFRITNAKSGKSKVMRIQKDDKLYLDVKYITAQDDKTILFTTNDFLYKLSI